MRSRVLIGLMALTACTLARNPIARAQGADWKPVEAAMGRASVEQPGNVHRFNFPRGDMHVTVDGVELKPAFALGGWIAMTGTPGNVMAMGDLVLTGEEVTPVITRLQAGGVEQTAIHHHVIRENPHVYYVHVNAHGDAVKIAETIRAALALTKVPAPSTAVAATGDPGIDTAAVAKALGFSGRMTGGVYQVTVPRSEVLHEGTMEIPAIMGLMTAINFQPTGSGNAAITGDFVLLASEVNPVIRVLREQGIEAVSLHSHLLNDDPRLYFMHFWANADAPTLARGLRAALAKTNSKRPGA